MISKCWYASYGSNLSRERFMCYIEGTKPKYAKQKQSGCRDRNGPMGDEKIVIPYDLYYAEHSSKWDGGVAFISSEKNKKIKTLGRMYLITVEQFIDVMLQENAKDPSDFYVLLDLDKVKEKEKYDTGLGWYGSILYLGDKDGIDIFTITTASGHKKSDYRPPGENYLRTIIEGLRETYDMPDPEILAYFKNSDGIKGNLTDEWLMGVIESTS